MDPDILDVLKSIDKELARKRKQDDLYYRRENHTRLWLYRLKHKSTQLGLPFNLDESDLVIPNYCPILGIELVIGDNKDNAPSVDRMVPSKGYTKGNVFIISNRANRIKNNATVDELRLIADYMDNNSAN